MLRVLLWLAGCVALVWLVTRLRLEFLARDLAVLLLAALWILGGAAALSHRGIRRRASEPPPLSAEEYDRLAAAARAARQKAETKAGAP